METDLQQMRTLVSESTLAPEVRQQCLWVITQLPPLYAEFGRTYDIRHRDRIAEYVQGIINTLAKQAAPEEARRVLNCFVSQLGAMHERLAIPTLTLKMPVPAKPSRKRKAA